MAVDIEEIEKKLLSLHYIKKGVYNVSYKKISISSIDVPLWIHIKEYDYSFGVRYTISITTDPEDIEDYETKTPKISLSLSWLTPECFLSGIEQMERKLVEAMFAALDAVPKEKP